ncbi:MAG: hypothetical protein AAB466_07925 [Verrucomicrobiota bacterium]
MNSKAVLRIARLPLVLFTTLLLLWFAAAKADQVEMENGDRYIGKVLLVDDKEVRLQNEIHGPMRLPRAKVVLISFRENAATAKPASPQSSAGKPVATDALPQDQIGGIDPKLLKQVEQEILGGAGPEANSMFTDIMKGYMSGAISLEDIRARARTSLAELKSLKDDLGEEVGPLLDGYVAILEKFVNETKESGPEKAGGKAAPGEKPKAGGEKKKPQ